MRRNQTTQSSIKSGVGELSLMDWKLLHLIIKSASYNATDADINEFDRLTRGKFIKLSGDMSVIDTYNYIRFLIVGGKQYDQNDMKEETLSLINDLNTRITSGLTEGIPDQIVSSGFEWGFFLEDLGYILR